MHGTKLLRLAARFAMVAVPAAIGVQQPALAASPAACDVSGIVARSLPAIVNITVVKVLSGSDDGDGGTSNVGDAASGPHFETFVGSGSIIDPAGIIITNKHVIQDAATIRVTLNNRTQVPAQLIAAATLMDLAVLKVNLPEPLPTLRFGDSDTAQVGQTVIAVGNPLGLGTAVSVGVVSARGRDLMRSPFDDFIQTDATINPGNSGGPLLNCSGQMIGVDTALLSNNRVLGSIGIGFAVPANEAQFVASKLINPDTARVNWIGLHLQNLTPRLATIFQRPDMSGAIVTRVDPASPAAAASLQPGDVIAGADGHELSNASAILRYVLTQPSGQPMSFLVWRRDQMDEVTLQGRPWPNLRALRADVLASDASVAQAQAAGLGLHLAAASVADRARFGIADGSGVLIDRVTPQSQADALGVKAGDVIERVGDDPAKDPAVVMHQLLSGAAADGDLVALLVHGELNTRWISLYVGRVYVADLLATPSLSGGFGSVSNAEVTQR